jgi:predicted nucleic acid-binding protein
MRRIWALEKSTLVTSTYAAEESRRNLIGPEHLVALDALLASVLLVPESLQYVSWASDIVPEKDAPILAAARGAKAAVLLTGDIKHFGNLMRRTDLPFRVCTARTFLGL